MEKKQKIKLADVECVDNRKMEGIEELAANIAAVGLLVPLLVMPYDGKYRVVDGRRRFRALQHLKREALEPEQYVIWRGSDEQEAEAAFCANFARQSLTLAEEVAQLRKLTGTLTQIAQLLGKTSSWVALRRNLANLSGKWIEVLNHPEDYPQWTPAKLEIIARETPEMQAEAAENIIDDADWSVKELKVKFAEAHRRISAFPFDTTPCKECLKRSDAQGMLFADDDLKDAVCLDENCFVHKAVEFVNAQLAGSANGIIFPVRSHNWINDEDRACGAEWPYAYKYKTVRPPRKDEKPNGIITCGEEIGQLRVVKPFPDSKDAKDAKDAKKTPGGGDKPKTEKTVAEREEALARKRNKLALQKLSDYLSDYRNEDTVEMWMERGHYDDQKAHEAFLKLVMWYGLNSCHGTPGDHWCKPIWTDITEFGSKVLTHARHCMRWILSTELGKTLEHISMEAGPGICGLLFLDWGEYMKAAEAEIPEPKSLQVARIKEQQAKTAAEKPAKKTTQTAKKKGRK